MAVSIVSRPRPRTDLDWLRDAPAVLTCEQARRAATAANAHDPLLAVALAVLALPGDQLVDRIVSDLRYAHAAGLVAESVGEWLPRTRRLLELLGQAHTRLRVALDEVAS